VASRRFPPFPGTILLCRQVLGVLVNPSEVHADSLRQAWLYLGDELAELESFVVCPVSM
jgi:hypothetical protein